MADEAHHRDVNHTFAEMKRGDPNPFLDMHKGVFVLSLIFVYARNSACVYICAWKCVCWCAGVCECGKVWVSEWLGVSLCVCM